MKNRLSFASDYLEGAHPKIMQRLLETNMEKSAGYGLDPYSESAREKIRAKCNAPEADVFFLVGGTQTNKIVIDAMLTPYQGVIAAESGHISVHEAGAIENSGHKVLTLPHRNGKILSEDVQKVIKDYWEDDNHEHMVMPGMVYISQPSEYGTIYSLEELEALSILCKKNNILLYLDGARLAYALASPSNNVSLPDIARLCDAFYIGGTKCGALFGEAVVFPQKNKVPHFITIIKQRGALLAKGRIAGIQFDTLFTDDLYLKVGENAVKMAEIIRNDLKQKGYIIHYDSPTNQIFVELTAEQRVRLEEDIEMGFWENLADDKVVMRLATSWATLKEDVTMLTDIL